MYGQFLSSSNVFIAPMELRAVKLLLLIASRAAAALSVTGGCTGQFA